MTILGSIHSRLVFDRRIQILSQAVAGLFPHGASVLDVGCGSGQVGKLIMEHEPSVSLSGIDVLVRDETHIPVTAFDGMTIPFEDDSFDCVLFVDVLHHTTDPLQLLREARRVCKHSVIIKDHYADGLFALSRLRFMDWVGNARFGVSLPYNYLTRGQWDAAFTQAGLAPEQTLTRLGLYTFPLNLAFEGGLHFISRLTRQ